MSGKLWFIGSEGEPIALFGEKRAAKDQLETYRLDDESGEYRLYGIDVEELEDYEEEFSLAEDEGFV